MFYRHILPIFSRIRVIQHFDWDFFTASEIGEGLGDNDPKVNISKTTCLEDNSLHQSASNELSCLDIGLRVLAVRVARTDADTIRSKLGNLLIHGT